MKQPVLRTLAITCTTLLLAACQAGPLAGKRNTVPVSTKPESSTLRIAYVGTAFENAALDYVIACYEKAHPDRSIERVKVAADNQAGWTSAQGTEVDIVPLYDYSQGVAKFVDLTPYIMSSDFDQHAYGSLLDKQSGIGALHALPLTVQPMLLAVNVDGLSSAGIPIPADGWTWDEFRAVLALLRQVHGNKPVFEAESFDALVQSYIEQRGGKPLWQAEERDVADALAYFDTLVNQDQTMVPVLPGRRITHDSFSIGETLVSLQEYQSGISPNFRVTWQYLPIPSFDPENRLTTTFVRWIGVTHDAEDPELAWDFLQFAASDEIAVGLAQRGMMPAKVTEPVRKAVGESATPGSATETLLKMRFTISPQEIGKERLTGAATMASARVLAGELTVDEALKQYRIERAREVAGNS